MDFNHKSNIAVGRAETLTLSRCLINQAKEMKESGFCAFCKQYHTRPVAFFGLLEEIITTQIMDTFQ